MRSFLMIVAGAAVALTAPAFSNEEDSLFVREAEEVPLGGFDDSALDGRDLDVFDEILAARDAEPILGIDTAFKYLIGKPLGAIKQGYNEEAHGEKYTRRSQYRRSLETLDQLLAIREADPSIIGKIVHGAVGLFTHKNKDKRDVYDYSEELLGRDVWNEFGLDEYDY